MHWRELLLGVSLAQASACAHQTASDPKEVVARYAVAAEKGDADAVYELLNARSRRALSREDVRRLLRDQGRELTDQASRAGSSAAEVSVWASVRHTGGEVSTMAFEGGRFRVRSTDALPLAGRTPEQTLEQLRRALLRRSYATLLRLLSPATRAGIESDVHALVLGLSRPEALHVQSSGETASVLLEGGHAVRLRRLDGVWFVEDFD